MHAVDRGVYFNTGVPLIRPPILYTTSSPKRGGGVFSSTQLVSIIRPLKKFRYVYDTAKFHIASTVRGLPTSARRAALQLEGHNIDDDFAVHSHPQEQQYCWS